MTFYEEHKGIVITDEEEFREHFCRKCKYGEICEEWEFYTGHRLYANKRKDTKELFVAPNKVEGVFRCASYKRDDDIK